jgi:hypothetical protein
MSQQIGSAAGGKLASSENPSQQQYPYFQSPGGVTPQQTALAEYDYGQNLTEGQAQFEGTGQGGGPSLSTMATQVAGGANTGQALDLARMSDVNQGAEFDAYKNAIGIDQQNNEAALAEQQQGQQQTLSDLAAGQSAAGTAAGLKTPLGATA